MNKPSIFFDNDPHHIDQVEDCRNILCIKVPGIDGLPREIDFMDLSDEDFTEHLGDATGNMIEFLIWANGGERDLFDSTSGMNVEHLSLLHRWLDESINFRERWAIFDFDRTISKIEGFGSYRGGMSGINDSFIRNNPGSLPIRAEEYMSYLCGKSRIPLLRNIFETCIRNDVKIVILTNNGACITDPTLITEFMSVLGVYDFELVCSRSYGSDKARALHEELMEVCPSLF